MDHEKYHDLRKAATDSFTAGNPAALVAVIEGADELYNGTDWSTWGDAERIVFGIMTGLRMAHPDTHGKVFMSSREAKVCIRLMGGMEATLEIAKLVWPELK